MLTIKNQPAAVCAMSFTFCTLLLLVAGCTEPGPRAFLEGNRLLAKGEYSGAIEKLQAATSLLQTNAMAWNHLGVACHHAGRWAEAEAAYLQALVLDRDLTEANYNLGCLYLDPRRPSKGPARSAQGGSGETPRADPWDEAAKARLTAYTLRRPTSQDGLLKLGTAQLRLREAKRAEQCFLEVLRRDPAQPEAMNGVGIARLQLGRAAEAEQWFGKALKAKPDYAPAVINLAVVEHQHLRNRQAALSHYRRYLEVAQDAPQAEAVSVLVRQLEQELSPSQTAAVRSPATNPTLALAPSPGSTATRPPPTNAVSLTVNTKAAPRQERASPAERSVTPAPTPSSAQSSARSNPAPPAAVPDQPNTASIPRYQYRSPARPTPGNAREAERSFRQGLQAHEKRRLSEAQAAYRQALRADPAMFRARYNLALACADAGDLNSASLEYENALALQPGSIDARYNFALVLKQAGFFIDAVNELEKVLGANPEEARAHLALANLFAQQFQQSAKARVHYVRVLEIDPRHPQTSSIRYWLAANPQ